jgi:alkylated DNA repair dioxygenase AlkB
MTLPIDYIPNFIDNPTDLFNTLYNELDWRRVDATPRREYYCHDLNLPYTYGAGRGERTYDPQPYHPALLAAKHKLEDFTNVPFEVLFLNCYDGPRDHLGNHRDYSDSTRPIAIISLGAERDIWFTPQSDVKDPSKRHVLKLQHGSLCLMLPGMQEEWFHRIPKASFECGPRISGTWRGYEHPAG